MSRMVENDLNRIQKLLQITESLNHIKDIDSVLDNILYQARTFTNADAGTIYLRDGDTLKFSYVQNDTLAKKEQNNNKYIYSILEVPISEESIAGYAALSGKSLIIDDVYDIPDEVPYSFNKYFDVISMYKTKSVLTIPLMTSGEKVIGVMQIINAKNDDGELISFTEDDKVYVTYFANSASVVIERAKMTREIILRMIKMAELRDPKETGSHVNRVAAYTIEIFERWASNKGIPDKEIRKKKDILRISAMLHDVGKVAISDAILKKPGKLDDEEFETMKYHTIYGARLFEGKDSELDKLSAIISLGHHEKWDGTGYPGNVRNIFKDNAKPVKKGRSGESIPIEARIVALADVYDALISRRVYKEPWNENDVLNHIREQSGKHFDPEVVDAFLSIYDIIKAIREKYTD